METLVCFASLVVLPFFLLVSYRAESQFRQVFFECGGCGTLWYGSGHVVSNGMYKSFSSMTLSTIRLLLGPGLSLQVGALQV